MITKSLETEIADFVIQFSDGIYTYADHEQIARYAMLHMMFGTFLLVRDKGEIIAVCRWNWITPEHAKVLDLIVHPDFRHKHIARNMLLKAKMAMPKLKRISFQRKKYAMRTSGIEVNRWLKEKNHDREIISHNN